MTKQEALEYVAEGHSMWTVEGAKEVVEAFGFEFPEGLITKWKGQKDANPNNEPKGLWLNKDEPGEGVASHQLSNWMVDKFHLKVREFFGRGSQARANAQAIKEHLSL